MCDSEPPAFGRSVKDQTIDKGENMKVKVPFSGDGPFKFKVRKNGKDVPTSNDRVKFTPFDDYVILQIQGSDIRYNVKLV